MNCPAKKIIRCRKPKSLDTGVIENAVDGLHKILSVGRDALWEISREMYASANNDGPFGGLPLLERRLVRFPRSPYLNRPGSVH